MQKQDVAHKSPGSRNAKQGEVLDTPRETDVWMRQVTREGSLSHRDHYRACRRPRRRSVSFLLQACRSIQTHVLVRAAGASSDPRQKRDGKGICAGAVRSWPAQASRRFQVPGPHGRTARSTPGAACPWHLDCVGASRTRSSSSLNFAALSMQCSHIQKLHESHREASVLLIC